MDFHRASSFDELLTANIRYLRGELPQTPYSLAPLALESRPLRARLERLHSQQRVFTFESQPGLRQVVRTSSGGGGVVETHQRAYCDAWVEAAALPRLLERLHARTDLCFFADVPGQPELFQHNVPAGLLWRDTQGAPHLNLTRLRCAASPAGLRGAAWDLHTNARLLPGWADEELRVLVEANLALRPVLAGCVLLGVMARQYGPHPAVLDALLADDS